MIFKSEVDSNIYVRVLKDSISPEGDRLFSIHAHYPRIILAEVNTHKIISKCGSSSRAIPILKSIEALEQNFFLPSYWGKNQSGMQAKEEISIEDQDKAKKIIQSHFKSSVKMVKKLLDLGLHKQVCNRYLEPFMYQNTIISATEWDNFFKLRFHEDCEPHFFQLAKCIKKAFDEHTPEQLLPGEWHLPFIDTKRDENNKLIYGLSDETGFEEVSLEIAKKISCSTVAQISYRKEDRTIDTANKVFDKLLNSEPKHSSCSEHQGTPIDYNSLSDMNFLDDKGITHMDRLYNLWGKNFKGWKMLRSEFEVM